LELFAASFKLKGQMTLSNSNTPPPDVAAAAAKVQAWLDGAPPARVTDEQFKNMDAKARLDYARRFPQHLESGRKT
jgi:hypothetical protein